jgi:hypothetical protein
MSGESIEELKQLLSQCKYVDQMNPRELSQSDGQWNSIKKEKFGISKDSPITVTEVRSATQVQGSDEESLIR